MANKPRWTISVKSKETGELIKAASFWEGENGRPPSGSFTAEFIALVQGGAFSTGKEGTYYVNFKDWGAPAEAAPTVKPKAATTKEAVKKAKAAVTVDDLI